MDALKKYTPGTENCGMKDRKIRILILADGNSIHTEKWLAGLSMRDEFELHLLSMNPAGVRKGIRENGRVRDIYEVYPRRQSSPQGWNYGYLFNLPRIAKIVDKVNPEVITTIYLSSYGFIGSLLKGRALLCHVMIGSDIMVSPFKNPIYRWISRYALNRADFYVSASKVMSNKIREIYPVREELLLTQQYGVEDEVIDYPPKDRIYDFVSNRSWLPNSNIPVLLEILSRLNSAGSLALIGGDGDPQTEKAVKEKISSFPWVQHLGILPYSDNIEAVSRSKFFLSLTSSDGASLSLMEAMALGVIPIVSDIEPNREWVEDGVNGVVINIGDIEGSARKIENILRLPEKALSEMRAKNYEIIQSRGSLRKNMNLFTHRILQLLQDRSKR